MQKLCATEFGMFSTPPLRFWSSICRVKTPGPAYTWKPRYTLRWASSPGMGVMLSRGMVSMSPSPQSSTNSGRSAGALVLVWVMISAS